MSHLSRVVCVYYSFKRLDWDVYLKACRQSVDLHPGETLPSNNNCVPLGAAFSLTALWASAVICLCSVMESCADSNVGERELATSQGDAAKRDPPSELSISAEAQVHVGGGKCTQVPVVSLAQCFVLVRRQPYFVSYTLKRDGHRRWFTLYIFSIYETPKRTRDFPESVKRPRNTALPTICNYGSLRAPKNITKLS